MRSHSQLYISQKTLKVPVDPLGALASSAAKFKKQYTSCLTSWGGTNAHPPTYNAISSVQFSHSVVSYSLQPHEPQHAWPPCPSQTPGVYVNSCPLSRCCHLPSHPVVPFSSCLQSFPTSGSFQMRQLFIWGGQKIGVSASTTALPVNTQDWSPLGQTGWISCSPGDSQESSPPPQFKSINSSALSFLYSLTLTFIHDYWKNHSLD